MWVALIWVVVIRPMPMAAPGGWLRYARSAYGSAMFVGHSLMRILIARAVVCDGAREGPRLQRAKADRLWRVHPALVYLLCNDYRPLAHHPSRCQEGYVPLPVAPACSRRFPGYM